MELLHTEQLNHMIERDKLNILYMKQPIQEKKADMEKILNSVLSVKALKTAMLKQVSKIERVNRRTNEDANDRALITESVKNDLIEDMYWNTIFDGVCENQMKIIEDKEKEEKQRR